MRLVELVTAGILMAVGAIVVTDSIRLGFRWGAEGPQSGFFPFWLSVVLIGASAAIIVQAARKKANQPFVSREQLNMVLKVLWPAALMVALTHFIGLYVASTLYLAFYMRWVGRHSWRTVVALAVVIPVATFLVFERWFLVPMPKGPLEAWLGY